MKKIISLGEWIAPKLWYLSTALVGFTTLLSCIGSYILYNAGDGDRVTGSLLVIFGSATSALLLVFTDMVAQI